LAWLLLGQPPGSEVTHSAGNQQQQLPRSGRVALLDISQDWRDVGHKSQAYRR
jgi:hypothetical protein